MGFEANDAKPLPTDATYLETKELKLGGRRAALVGVSVRFQAEAEPDQWQKFLRSLNLETRRAASSETATFTALPLELKPLSPCINGSVTLSTQRPSVAQWKFSWYRAPDDAPPESFLLASSKLGGFPSVLDTLESLWPAHAPVQAEVSASYVIISYDLRLRFSSMRPKKIRTGAQQMRLVPARWLVEPPAGPVKEITFHELEHRDFVLTGKGHYTFRWTRHFLNETDGAVWGGLERFLEPR